MTKQSFTAMLTLAALALGGCALDPKTASPPEIAANTDYRQNPQRQQHWKGPEIINRRYRSLFYGYDTVYSRLAAQREANGETSYQILIDVFYGDRNKRDYSQVKLANGSVLPVHTREHIYMQCDFFNTLVYACLFRDRASIDLSPAELQAGLASGLNLQLGSASADFDPFTVPANYFAGFVQAVEHPETANKED